MSFPNKRHRWLAGFFAFGATMSGITIALLRFPGSALDPIWRLNPNVRTALVSLGSCSVVLMFVVSAGCATAAIGLWRGLRWAIGVAIAILSLNLVGDLANAAVDQDYRSLIGVPMAGTLMFYLMRSR